jgi:hypothetical protein
MELSEAGLALQRFGGDNLTRTLAEIESSLSGTTIDTCSNALSACGAENQVLGAAGMLKQLAGQVNVIIHGLGILLCLPHLLQSGEVIEYASLGVGNTGRAFDLETNQRIAEFKFIQWQGGPEAIRQNALFKDFYLMAEHRSEKRKRTLVQAFYKKPCHAAIRFVVGEHRTSDLDHHRFSFRTAVHSSSSLK